MNDTMTPFESDRNTFDEDRLIDQLVDGELDGCERRRLLERLDSVPDGWRRCAIAFLEGQAWRQAMASEDFGVAAAPASAGVTAVVSSALHEKGRRERPLAVRSVLALAATLLAAFALGWSLRDPQFLGNGFARLIGPSHDKSEVMQDVHDGATEPSDGDSLLPPPPVRFVGLLTWKINDDGTEREVSVPIVEGEAIDEQWLMRQPPAIPQSIVREMERRGHKVAANRQLLSIDLEDGRRALLPIDQLEVRSGSRVFQ